MWLLRMAWMNLWRNRGRTLISITAVFFAVVLSVLLRSIQGGAFEHLIDNLVGYYSGYAQVHKRGYHDEQTLENTFSASAVLENKIRSTSKICWVCPRLESFALAASGDVTKGVMVVGIDPQIENKAIALGMKKISGKYIGKAFDEVMISDGLLKRLKSSLNDTLILIGQGYHGATAAGRYRITGIVHFGAPQLNDQVVFMTLASAQELFGTGNKLTSYVLFTHNNSELDESTAVLSQKLGKAYEVERWDEMMPDIKQHMQTDQENIRIFMGILYVLVTLGIFGTLLMMLVERSYELGMLLAIGMQKSTLILILLLESIFTVMAGCAMGLMCSFLPVYYFNQNPIRFTGEMGRSWERFGFEAVIPASTNPSHFLSQGAVVLCIGLVLSVYPAWKIMRMNPVISMKS